MLFLFSFLFLSSLSLIPLTLCLPVNIPQSKVHLHHLPVAKFTDLLNLAIGDSGTTLVIGANTGNNRNDLLWGTITQKNPEVIFVEPIPHYFNQLQLVINDAKLTKATTIQAAVTKEGKNITLYCAGIDSNGVFLPGFPDWIMQCCSSSIESFSTYKLYMTKEKIHNTIRKFDVQGISVLELIHNYVKSELRVIQIDTQGGDYEV